MNVLAERSRLGPDRVAAVDRSNLMGDVLAQPDQLADALERAIAARVPRSASARNVVFCGMGGSAIGGDLATGAVDVRARRRLEVLRGYPPRRWLHGDALVVCMSYSGNTEETLACYGAAEAAGAPRAAITTGGELARRARRDGVPLIEPAGGLQPRAAVAYMVVAALEMAAAAGAAPALPEEVHGAELLLRRLVRGWGPDSPDGTPPKLIAESLHDAVPVVYGAGPTTAVARRWKGQVNENAKAAAFWSELPEADHNEICSFERARLSAGLVAVFLDSPGLAPEHTERLDLTAAAAREAGVAVEVVQGVGETALERLLSLVLLGDLVSVNMAVLAGVDPTPVEPIDRFKKALSSGQKR